MVVSGYQMVREALVHQAEIFADRPHIPLLQEIFRGFGKYSFQDFGNLFAMITIRVKEAEFSPQ